jgi:uncharacterized membrane protein YfcA
MTAVIGIFMALGAVTLTYLSVLVGSLRRSRAAGAPPPVPSAGQLTLGFVTNFFDTLGIGSFATTTAGFKFWKMLPDELIPGTLNVGHTASSVMQAFIFIIAIQMDPLTLSLLLASAAGGAWFGAGLVAGLPRRSVQLGMGTALLVAAVVMTLGQLNLVPVGGSALALHGWKLAVGVGGNFVLGALMTLGIGLYAPCMMLVSLLGMNPSVAFPIMMGSCAFLMPVASLRFIERSAFQPRVAMGLAIGGVFAVPVAAFVVKSLPLTMLRWVVIVVVVYAAVLMLRSAMTDAIRARPLAFTPES